MRFLSAASRSVRRSALPDNSDNGTDKRSVLAISLVFPKYMSLSVLRILFSRSCNDHQTFYHVACLCMQYTAMYNNKCIRYALHSITDVHCGIRLVVLRHIDTDVVISQSLVDVIFFKVTKQLTSTILPIFTMCEFASLIG